METRIPMRNNLPNYLTICRLILAIAFMWVLSTYEAADPNSQILDLATLLFVIAAITDFLDGYLARKWQIVSTFGRIMDPVSDKILVIGAFVFLAGTNFVIISPDSTISASVTGVYPWMVMVILARELLVTAIRSVAESMGIKFGSMLTGKLKMILQAIVIPVILFLVAHWDPQNTQWAAYTRDGLIYLTLVATVLSGWPYVIKSLTVLKQPTP